MKKFIFFVLLLCSGCVQPNAESVTYANQEYVNSHIARHIDSEAGVVCWVYLATGGVSCLPISQTKLGEKK